SRIHDNQHRKHDMEYQDRFNQTFTLAPGWNDLSISLDKVKTAPRGRTMDMEHIEGFGLFVVRLPQPQALYLDHIYLAR
ncbi:MAG: succinyl-CoA synthetase subunit beta, partial [Proteobacteria bacterium]|nr:succinyl-CoA synthetase subunit beta [Pseudomonadota bacterium]